MPKRKGNTTQAAERKTDKKERIDCVDELAKALAALKTSESRCAQLTAEKQAQHEQLQTLQTQNEQLRTQLAKREEHSVAQINDLTLEVDELKTELAFFRSLNISLLLNILFKLLVCHDVVPILSSSHLPHFLCVSGRETRLLE